MNYDIRQMISYCICDIFSNLKGVQILLKF